MAASSGEQRVGRRSSYISRRSVVAPAAGRALSSNQVVSEQDIKLALELERLQLSVIEEISNPQSVASPEVRSKFHVRREPSEAASAEQPKEAELSIADARDVWRRRAVEAVKVEKARAFGYVGLPSLLETGSDEEVKLAAKCIDALEMQDNGDLCIVNYERMAALGRLWQLSPDDLHRETLLWDTALLASFSASRRPLADKLGIDTVVRMLMRTSPPLPAGLVIAGLQFLGALAIDPRICHVLVVEEDVLQLLHHLVVSPPAFSGDDQRPCLDAALLYTLQNLLTLPVGAAKVANELPRLVGYILDHATSGEHAAAGSSAHEDKYVTTMLATACLAGLFSADECRPAAVRAATSSRSAVSVAAIGVAALANEEHDPVLIKYGAHMLYCLLNEESCAQTIMDATFNVQLPSPAAAAAAAGPHSLLSVALAMADIAAAKRPAQLRTGAQRVNAVLYGQVELRLAHVLRSHALAMAGPDQIGTLKRDPRTVAALRRWEARDRAFEVGTVFAAAETLELLGLPITVALPPRPADDVVAVRRKLEVERRVQELKAAELEALRKEAEATAKEQSQHAVEAADMIDGMSRAQWEAQQEATFTKRRLMMMEAEAEALLAEQSAKQLWESEQVRLIQEREQMREELEQMREEEQRLAAEFEHERKLREDPKYRAKWEEEQRLIRAAQERKEREEAEAAEKARKEAEYEAEQLRILQAEREERARLEKERGRLWVARQRLLEAGGTPTRLDERLVELLKVLDLERYIPKFCILEWTDLFQLSDQNLQEMGIKALGPRARLLAAVQQMLQDDDLNEETLMRDCHAALSAYREDRIHAALRHLVRRAAQSRTGRMMIASAGIVSLLARVLERSKEAKVQSLTIELIGWMALESFARVEMRRSGTVALLLRLVDARAYPNSPETLALLLIALKRLSKEASTKAVLRQTPTFGLELMRLALSDGPATHLAINLITVLAAGSPAFQSSVLKIDNAIGLLVQLLSNPDDAVQEQALRAIAALATGPPGGANSVVQKYMGQATELQRLEKLLSCNNPLLQSAAVLTLGAVAAGNPHARQTVVERGLVRAITLLLSVNNQRLQHSSARAVRMMCEDSPDMRGLFFRALAVGPLCQMAVSPNFFVAREALGALSELVAGNTLAQRLVMSSVGDSPLHTALSSSSKRARLYAGRLLLRVLTGSPSLLREIVGNQALVLDIHHMRTRSDTAVYEIGVALQKVLLSGADTALVTGGNSGIFSANLADSSAAEPGPSKPNPFGGPPPKRAEAASSKKKAGSKGSAQRGGGGGLSSNAAPIDLTDKLLTQAGSVALASHEFEAFIAAGTSETALISELSHFRVAEHLPQQPVPGMSQAPPRGKEELGARVPKQTRRQGVKNL